VDLDARHRIGLEGATGRDTEGWELPALDELADDRLHGIQRGGHPIGQRTAGHADDAGHSITDGLGPGIAREVEQDASGELPEGQGTDIASSGQEVPREMPQEQGTVPALEAQLVIVNDDGRPQTGHGLSRSGERGHAPVRAPRGYSRS